MPTPAVPYSAPNFTLKDSDGKAHSLADYSGRWLILYFYPKDDTPGCTIEACSFRDSHEQLLSKKAVVVGVSRDGADSHSAFTASYSLPFTLLSDPDHKTMDAYGAWGKKMFGTEGVQRKTYIINPDGMVVKVYGRVIPTGHAAQVLAELEKLQARR